MALHRLRPGGRELVGLACHISVLCLVLGGKLIGDAVSGLTA